MIKFLYLNDNILLNLYTGVSVVQKIKGNEHISKGRNSDNEIFSSLLTGGRGVGLKNLLSQGAYAFL